MDSDKQEHYPLWMKEFLNKDKQFHEKLTLAKTEIQQVNQGCQEFDEKKKFYKQQQKNYQKPQLRADPVIVGNYHHYYQQLKLERNSKLSSQKLNPLILGKIILFLPNPIQTALGIGRVCKQWNNICNSIHFWSLMIQHILDAQILSKIEKQEDYKIITIYMVKEFHKCKRFCDFNQASFLTKQLTRDCIQSLKIIQQIISIPWQCSMKNQVINFCKSKDFKCLIESLLESQNDIIKKEAQSCFITLYDVCQYQYKRIKGLEPLIMLKKRINEEPINIQLPANIYYRIQSEDGKIDFKLRDFNQDYLKIKSLNIYKYDALMTLFSGNITTEIMVNFTIKKQNLEGIGMHEQELVQIFGIFKVLNPNKIVFSAYDNGIQSFGNGYLNITRNDQIQKFLIYLCQDQQGYFNIVGQSNQEFVIFKFI